ncbi:MAG: glycoside hydrolase family 13 protein [Ruminococcaceae bacterium]|nr:glycoside hydrolase family 13 protein [Oscillospiraceae bacterium]
MIFNSRNIEYKSIYGAVKAGDEITFRLLLPNKELGVAITSARLLICNDNDSLIVNKYDLTPTNEYKDECQFWEVKYLAKEPGLYWYCFEYQASSITWQVYKGNYSTGYINIPENKWQLTVYDDAQTIPDDWKGGIMYQIFPDRFYNSGSKKLMLFDRKMRPWGEMPAFEEDLEFEVWNNDYQGGDLKGIEEKLPYVKELGVDIIYLNPIFEAHSNHRYNTADYTKIDSFLGTENDFIELCMAAHKMGIKIILDGVFSHTGDDSIYFNKKNRYDSVGAYNSADSEYYPWYKFERWPDKFISWWGIEDLPEVNEMEESYIEFICGEDGILAKWLRLGADGWRLDVADELPDEFIKLIRARIKQVKPDALLIGEVWEDASNKTAYGIRRQYLLGDELDSVTNYPFKNAIIDFIVNDDAEFFMDKILTITENYPKEIVDTLMNPLGTHDTVRILTRLSGEDCEGAAKNREWQSTLTLSETAREHAKKRLKIAAAIQYTLPGFPSIYYGDEIGMEGGKDPFNRKAFPWGDLDMDLLGFFENLGKIRQNNRLIFKDAPFVPISGADGCIAYAREKDGNSRHSIILIANRSLDTINYCLPEYVQKPTKLLGDAKIIDNLVLLPPESFVILENIWIYKKQHREDRY